MTDRFPTDEKETSSQPGQAGRMGVRLHMAPSTCFLAQRRQHRHAGDVVVDGKPSLAKLLLSMDTTDLLSGSSGKIVPELSEALHAAAKH